MESSLRPGDRVLHGGRFGTIRCDSAVSYSLVIVDWDGDPPTTTCAVRRDTLQQISLLEELAYVSAEPHEFKDIQQRCYAYGRRSLQSEHSSDSFGGP